MEKTGQMIEFEEETRGYAIVTVKVGYAELQFPSEVYVEWLEAELLKASVKAAAYDRLMSGGRKTLKELANFLGMNVAVEDEEIYGKKVFASPIRMFLKENTTIYGSYKFWALSETGPLFLLPPELIDYTGSWQDSLTLPDREEKKHE